ncbi:unnamed protein product [Cuscuta campestris]|uniref:Secreted protein n=1 Tax=Cuscuta campestris TaxID=132261 RepID=A0A484LYF5_9ASTE|nr:unnamed protein product [Cuscuta campestris]
MASPPAGVGALLVGGALLADGLVPPSRVGAMLVGGAAGGKRVIPSKRKELIFTSILFRRCTARRNRRLETPPSAGLGFSLCFDGIFLCSLLGKTEGFTAKMSLPKKSKTETIGFKRI